MSDIEIEIDGKKCQAKPNAMVIQVADEAGIYIPRFCYHKHLSIAANCRMCLVEVEKAPKPMPACATPVMAGMKVFTKSPKALASQKAVMEFLLINHPLDCPICDQGGECELQDLSMGYGSSDSFYHEGKRSIEDQDLGPLISTEMTRCIMCTRCVRFGDEVAGLRELGVTSRGENDRIRVYLEKSIQSEVSGNVIDLCPVGALTSKPFRFTARAWELDQRPSIAAHDCLGSNINVHTRYGKVMRVVPRENNQLNLTWISDRDRFSYQGLNHADRIEKPLVRVDGKWKQTDWQTALDIVVGKLQKTMSAHGVEQFGALASPNSTVEELYLLQKVMRELGTHNIDHRLRQIDFADQESMPLFPGSNESLAEIEQADTIVMIGANIQKEQPIAAVRVRKAVLQGAKAISINMMDYRFHFEIAEKIVTSPNEFVFVLAGVAKALGCKDTILNDVTITDAASAIANILKDRKNIKLILGALAQNHPQAATIRTLSQMIEATTQAKIIYMTEGANTAGAWLAGVVPHRMMGGKNVDKPGLDAQAMFAKKLKAYLVLNVEPDLDCANPNIAIQALTEAETVIALSMFMNPVLEKHAHVILPITPYTETSGTFVNVFGAWQSFNAVATTFSEARPAWKVLRVLGNWLQLPNFEYNSSEEVRDELKAAINESFNPITKKFSLTNIQNTKTAQLIRIGEVPIYSGDSILRRAEALQATQLMIDEYVETARVNADTAKRLQCESGEDVKVTQGEFAVLLPMMIDNRVPDNTVAIAAGLQSTSGLSDLFGEIQIEKSNRA